MAADPEHPADRGFPRPVRDPAVRRATRRAHLSHGGNFRADALRVTGSPRLDELVAASRGLSPRRSAARARGRGRRSRSAGAGRRRSDREARRALPRVPRGGRARCRTCGWPSRRTRPRPPELYAAAAGRRAERPRARGRRAAGAARWPRSRAVVTVNSTVAIDAAVLGVPALVIGLPNNLSPVRRGRRHGRAARATRSGRPWPDSV